MLTTLGRAAFQYMNVPYKWGGSNYLGLDCSGLIIKVFHDIGLTVHDMTSQDIYKWMLKNKTFESIMPEEDCLLFFGKSTSEITHVALAIDSKWMIEAGGAGRNSLTMTPEELAFRDARVRLRLISTRRDLVACLKFDGV
jgi:cell wall-associated NlpC family hydrolase